MTKHVIVIASGETERRSLPRLVMHLQDQNVYVDEVRYPPGNKALNVDMAEKLVKAVWYENVAGPPDKFVVLLDVDGKAPDEVLRPLEEQLPGRLGADIQASIQYAYAQWHLEACWICRHCKITWKQIKAPNGKYMGVEYVFATGGILPSWDWD